MPRVDQFLRKHFGWSWSPPIPKGAREDARESSLSDMLPYVAHYDQHTVLTKHDALVQVIKLEGLYFESLSPEQIKVFERRRNTVLRSIASSDRGIYVHVIRRRVKEYPAGEGRAWFARQFNSAWRERYAQQSFFANEIYISLIQNPFRQGVPGVLDRIFSWLTGHLQSPAEMAAVLEKQAGQLYEASSLLVQSLAEYGARRLGLLRHPPATKPMLSKVEARALIKQFEQSWRAFEEAHGSTGPYSREHVVAHLGRELTEIGRFFYYLVNLQDQPIPLTSLPMDQSLAASWIDCRMTSHRLAVHHLSGSRVASIISMAEWPSRTNAKMLDDFLRQPAEFVLTQSFFFTDRISAEHEMRQERRRQLVNNADGTAQDDAEELTQGLQDLKRGHAIRGLHHLTLLVHVPLSQAHADTTLNKDQTLRDLEAAITTLQQSFINLGVKAVREGFAQETFFWSQLPGQAQHFIGRRGKIDSRNFAGFASLHNFAAGKIDGNLWGNAIMPFETESGTAYHFNFHREVDGMVAGHTAITADTGAGKTTLLSALIAMADKVNPRVFWFDNKEGARVFIAAMGGRHTQLSVHQPTGWNPFQLPDTPANRSYLVELLTLMRTCYGGDLLADDVERFKVAVHENYQLPLIDRRLQNIAWCFGQAALGKDMQVWHNANGQLGANAAVFDNAQDQFDLSQCRYHCFEMGQLIKDGAARPELSVVLSYPFHRIEQAMDGEPFIIVLEEGQNLVGHAFWRDKIDSYIMQIRRKNGLLIFVTPDAKYLYSHTDAIQKQTVTKIFLPNGEAQASDYQAVLGLTSQEFEFIRDTPPEQRKFLICSGRSSVKARFDLSDLQAFIPVLSSNDKGIALMAEIKAELRTEEPEVWVPVFMERSLARNTHNLVSTSSPFSCAIAA